MDPSDNNISRRDLLRSIALAVTTGSGALRLQAGKHVHHAVSKEKKKTGTYSPQCFNAHEYGTLQHLCDLILPADEYSGSALDAGAPEFIDLLSSQNEELARIFISGIFWLDREMERRHARLFLKTPLKGQTQMLDSLAKASCEPEEVLIGFQAGAEYASFEDYKSSLPMSLEPGVHFFNWVRRLTADAFYTSPIGFQDVGYAGNKYRTEYEVPQEAIDYVLKRSPLD